MKRLFARLLACPSKTCSVPCSLLLPAPVVLNCIPA